MNHSIERVIRLVTSCVAVLALGTVALAPTWACQTHGSAVTSPLANSPVEHQADDSDCGKSSQAPTRHTNDCLLTCAVMAGCGSPGLVSERVFDTIAAMELVAPLSLDETYSSLSLEPDRPPPRS